MGGYYAARLALRRRFANGSAARTSANTRP
jgi:hypothetical protein